MKKRFIPFLAGVALLTGAANGAASPVTISVDMAKPGATIAPDFSGLSYEVHVLLPNENGIRYFRPDNQPLITLFHTLGIKSLRIGGNSSDRDARELPNHDDLDSFFQFARAADVKVIYCLRLHDGDPQTDAQTAKYIMDHYAAQMDSFSIGQEPSAYPTSKVDNRPAAERMGGSAEKFKYATYAADWKRFADTISAAVPGIRFCGPSVHNNGAWARDFIQDFGQSNHVALVTEHLYPGGAGGKVPTPEIGRDRMLSDDFVKRYETLRDSFAPQARAAGLPYRLEEVNNYFNGGATNVSNTYAAALWGLDFMYWWASNDAAGLNFHTGDKVAAGNTLRPSKYTAFYSTLDGYEIRPLAYGITAFNVGSHGHFVSATVSNPDHLNLSVYAVSGDDKNIYVTIINKEHGTDARPAVISLSGNGMDTKAAQAMVLSAPSNDLALTTGETLGGVTIQSDGTWNGTWMPLSGSDVTVPPASAVIVKLPAQ